MSDVSFAEVFVKLPHCGSARAAAAGYCVNATELYAASRRNAFDTSPPSYAGRSCLADYIAKGYVTADGACDAAVSRSLNYYHSDYAIAQMALALGEADDAAVLLQRASRWRELFEPSTAFLRPKTAAGAFLPAFDEFAWGPQFGYTVSRPPVAALRCGVGVCAIVEIAG